MPFRASMSFGKNLFILPSFLYLFPRKSAMVSISLRVSSYFLYFYINWMLLSGFFHLGLVWDPCMLWMYCKSKQMWEKLQKAKNGGPVLCSPVTETWLPPESSLTLSSWVWVEWRPSYYPTLPSWVWVESRSDCRRRRGTGNGEGDEKTKQKINHWVTELCICFYRTCHQLYIYLLNSAHWLLNIFLRNWWEVVRYANGCGCPTPSITLHYFKVLHDCLEEMVSFLSPYILP